MYTELQSVVEARGKTVHPEHGITFSSMIDQVIIAFTDETFLTLGVEHGYEGDDTVAQQWLLLYDFGRDSIMQSGIITEEEFQQKGDNRRNAELQAREEAERRRYEQLKEKFGET